MMVLFSIWKEKQMNEPALSMHCWLHEDLNPETYLLTNDRIDVIKFMQEKLEWQFQFKHA